MKPEQILIGGPASAGTTLVAIILNSHPEIWCGEEASVFDRPSFFEMEGKRLAALMKVDSYNELDQSMPYTITIVEPQPMSYCGLSSWRWDQVFLADRPNMIASLENDWSPIALLDEMFSDPMRKAGKGIWAEKSPGNVFCMGQIKKAYPNSKRLVVVRNPYDCIMSLCFHRNFSLNNAVMRWIVSMNAAEEAYRKHGAHIVSYDHLVSSDPMTVDAEILKLFLTLEVECDEATHESVKSKVKGDHNTWDTYKNQLGDGALEVIARTCVAPWVYYSELFNITSQDFTFPNFDEEI